MVETTINSANIRSSGIAREKGTLNRSVLDLSKDELKEYLRPAFEEIKKRRQSTSHR